MTEQTLDERVRDMTAVFGWGDAYHLIDDLHTALKKAEEYSRMQEGIGVNLVAAVKQQRVALKKAEEKEHRYRMALEAIIFSCPPDSGAYGAAQDALKNE